MQEKLFCRMKLKTSYKKCKIIKEKKVIKMIKFPKSMQNF